MFEASLAAGALLLDNRQLPELTLTFAAIHVPLLLSKSMVRHKSIWCMRNVMTQDGKYGFWVCAVFPFRHCAHPSELHIRANTAAVSE